MADTTNDPAQQAAGMASEAMGNTADTMRQAGQGATDAARQAGERMQAAGGAMTEQGSKLGLTVLSQAETNTQEAFKAMRAAAQAKDVSEVMRIQSEYMREQGNRSMTQAREIGEMIASFGRNAIGQMTGRG